ncbi:hypothetical protein [Mesorhizobium sp. KR9-304]|uniref:hypothetical protein n=1 Tax=Mesorhizobium sp. KR9-304 TaxID=3156614 RepID=UPI0032B4855B
MITIDKKTFFAGRTGAEAQISGEEFDQEEYEVWFELANDDDDDDDDDDEDDDEDEDEDEDNYKKNEDKFIEVEVMEIYSNRLKIAVNVKLGAKADWRTLRVRSTERVNRDDFTLPDAVEIKIE